MLNVKWYRVVPLKIYDGSIIYALRLGYEYQGVTKWMPHKTFSKMKDVERYLEENNWYRSLYDEWIDD